jgi:NDP-sugar pyrophosphorylase family protein
MKAMILAAGLGTRLRPLTDTHPKALVEINGRTLFEITLARLRTFGVTDVIINVHHFADMLVHYLKSKNNFGMRIEISREDDLLLDTGGGLKKAAWFFLENARHSPLVTRDSPTEPFLLHNVDVISNIDLRRMLQFHNENHALATLAVQSRPSSRLLLFDDQLQLSARAAPAEKAGGTGNPACAPTPSSAPDQSTRGGDDSRTRGLQPSRNARQGSASVHPEPQKAVPKSVTCHSERSEESAFSSNSPLANRHSPLLHPLAFSGIHVISPRLLAMLTEDGVFSIIDAYLRLAAQGEKILAFRADEYYWRDLGRPADLAQAALDLQQGNV